MKSPGLPSDERERLNRLHALRVLDTPGEERFDRFTRMAQRLFDVPIALVSLVDRNRQWFKSCVGLEVSETPRAISFCGHAILGRDLFIVEDARLDPRFADNPLVTGPPNIRFYAGCPIPEDGTSSLGTFCLIDRRPRVLGEADAQMLRDLGGMVASELITVERLSLDPLTRAFNRKTFIDFADKSIARVNRSGEPLSLVTFDIEGLHSINLAHGQTAGDTALTDAADYIRQVTREQDLIGRLGADEFGALLVGTYSGDAGVLLERLNEAIRVGTQAKQRPFTLSLRHGSAAYDPESHTNVDDLLQDAEADRRRRS